MSISYDELAEIYEELYGPEQFPKNLAVAVLVKGAEKILDAGCGTGMLESLLDASTYHVCLDLSYNMLRRYTLTRRRGGDPLVGDMRMPPLRCCFDAVVAVTSIHEAPEAADALASLVKEGGLFVLTVKEGLPRPKDPGNAVLVKKLKSGREEILVYRVTASTRSARR